MACFKPSLPRDRGGVAGRFKEAHYEWCGRDNVLCLSSLRQPEREKKTRPAEKIKNQMREPDLVRRIVEI